MQYKNCTCKCSLLENTIAVYVNVVWGNNISAIYVNVVELPEGNYCYKCKYGLRVRNQCFALHFVGTCLSKRTFYISFSSNQPHVNVVCWISRVFFLNVLSWVIAGTRLPPGKYNKRFLHNACYNSSIY